jgi:simple sugar transport system permease protein
MGFMSDINGTAAGGEARGSPPPDRFQQRMNKSLSVLGGSARGMAAIILISLLVIVLLVLLLSKSPAKTLILFFLGPLRNVYYFGNMLNSSVPLIFGGLGITVAIRAGNLNLGGEGQIYSGAFVTTVVAIALARLGPFGAVLALLSGMVFSGLVAALSGFCKARWNTNELITTFLLSNALILVINYCITGPFKDPATNLQSTQKIPEIFYLPRVLPPSNLSAALFIALAAAVLVWVFLYRTRSGYDLRMSGLSPMFSRYGGISPGISVILSMFISGAFYGLGGGLAIYGTYYSAIKEFSSGFGWNSLAAAFIARSRPLFVIPAALFFAWINSGARMAMQFSDVTYEIASLVQSVVFFLVTAGAVLELFKKGNIK